MKESINKSIYIISFFEGAAVMATELCGSKLIAPYYGSSLYVWAAVIAVTLGSLAAGYFYGGRLSTSENKTKTLLSVLLIATAYMGLMPLISNLFGSLALHFSLLLAVICSSALLLFIPMFLMGAASPLVIAIQTATKNESGQISGTVYSISTLGGIISTFLCGFYLIPSFGINNTLLIFAALLALSLLLLLQKKNNFKILTVLLVLLALGFTSKAPSKNCIYQTDGILGKLNVIDDTVQENHSTKVIRKLLVNNVVQTEMDLQTHQSVSHYIRILDSNTTMHTDGKALVLGLGGGLTSNLLSKKGYAVSGVELDERIIEAARSYFFLNPAVKTYCDDARRFINITTTKYDLVLMDIFKAEEQPVHVITSESLKRLKAILTDNAQVFINWHGYLKGERGIGTSILLNTLKQNGFNYKLCADTDKEDERNLVIVASLKPLPALQFEINEAIQATDLINTDNRPLLEKYNVLANQSWRKNYILYYYSGN